MTSRDLSEDTVDDLLYFARTADVEELNSTLKQVTEESSTNPSDILMAAKDVHTGNTMLHMAAANGHSEIIKLLLSLTNATASNPLASATAQPAPALIDVPNHNGNTPLHWAALNGHLEAVKVLVDAGANLLAKNNSGHDVAYEAELAGKEQVVSWLLSEGNYEEPQVNEEEGDSLEAESVSPENNENAAG